MAAESSKIDHDSGTAIKLATVELKRGVVSAGLVRGEFFWPVQQILGISDPERTRIRDMNDLIHSWDIIADKISHQTFESNGTPLAEVKLLAPIPRPTGTIMCVGKNYLDHVKEVDSKFTTGKITAPDAPQYPIIFTKAPQSVIGSGAAIRYPHGASSQVDYEAELGVIIKTAGRGIKKADAMRHVLGYTIINDVTARDIQKNHQQWFLGKSCDTFCPMGPWIVPATEVDGLNLKIECWVNDELRQSGRTSQMLFGIAELIEVISAGITIQPGDIIATGTPAGVGSGFIPPKHLKPGDRVRIRIEGIGELTNAVE
ncbi:hypothetical protein R1flu_025411 [Riccia fluitans]|uniref:Fumarylacetoacetase-like C-terminal domain-containing protein n=1 Tax=Riccia fluitans TaxID=41844 RepID=A0ABD1XXQ2_9MARC